MTASLHDRILARLQADPKAESPWDLYVLAALDGERALSAALSDQRKPEKASKSREEATAPEPRGAYLKSIAVEGFRGIGPKATLELPPGPGLTLVVGRNGSGKSSFAEALELLLTGDTFRWRKPRSMVWREGWRNLHHKPAAIEAEFHIEGEKGLGCVARRWVALQQKDWGLDGAETVLARDTAATAADSSLGILRQLAGAPAPNPDLVAGVVNDLRLAHKRQQAAAGTLAARSKDLADILDQALRFHTQYGDGDCPVCGKPKALDKAWHAHKQEETKKLRDAAREATTAQQAGESVRRRAQQLPMPSVDVLARAKQIGLDAQPAIEALEHFKAKAQAVWNQLRLQSNVALDDIRLSGSAPPSISGSGARGGCSAQADRL